MPPDPRRTLSLSSACSLRKEGAKNGPGGAVAPIARKPLRGPPRRTERRQQLKRSGGGCLPDTFDGALRRALARSSPGSRVADALAACLVRRRRKGRRLIAQATLARAARRKRAAPPQAATASGPDAAASRDPWGRGPVRRGSQHGGNGKVAAWCGPISLAVAAAAARKQGGARGCWAGGGLPTPQCATALERRTQQQARVVQAVSCKPRSRLDGWVPNPELCRAEGASPALRIASAAAAALSAPARRRRSERRSARAQARTWEGSEWFGVWKSRE